MSQALRSILWKIYSSLLIVCFSRWPLETCNVANRWLISSSISSTFSPYCPRTNSSWIMIVTSSLVFDYWCPTFPFSRQGNGIVGNITTSHLTSACWNNTNLEHSVYSTKHYSRVLTRTTSHVSKACLVVKPSTCMTAEVRLRFALDKDFRWHPEQISFAAFVWVTRSQFKLG